MGQKIVREYPLPIGRRVEVTVYDGDTVHGVLSRDGGLYLLTVGFTARDPSGETHSYAVVRTGESIDCDQETEGSYYVGSGDAAGILYHVFVVYPWDEDDDWYYEGDDDESDAFSDESDIDSWA